MRYLSKLQILMTLREKHTVDITDSINMSVFF